MRQRIPPGMSVIEPDVIAEIALEVVPARAWVPASRDTIYPIEVPEIEFEKDLDLLLIDCPEIYVGALMEKTGVRRAQLLKMVNHGSGRVRLEGSHSEILNNPEIGHLYLGGTLSNA